MSKQAIILGNGKSRLKIDLSKEVIRTYGCNAAYRDTKVTDLVAVDPAIQHEIYCSGYAREHACYFTSWSPNHDSREVEQFSMYTDRANIIENKKKEKCNIAGQNEKFYVTWVYENDSVRVLPPATKSAGEIAVELALKHKSIQVFLLGFDGTGNIYKGTENYHDAPGPFDAWSRGLVEIMNENLQAEFYMVDCNLHLEIHAPNCRAITKEQFELRKW